MRDREWYEVASEAMVTKRKPRRRKMVTVKLPDDPAWTKRKNGRRKARHPLAKRTPMRGDRIGESEQALWLNVGRVIDEAPGKINGRPIA